MKKLILSIFLPLTLAFGVSDSEIANSLNFVSQRTNMNKTLLYLIADIESSFNNNIIAFQCDKKFIQYLKKFLPKRYKISYSKYKNRYLVSVKNENTKELENLVLALWDMGLKLDIGLMQINQVNLNKNDVALFFNPNFSVAKASEVLQGCSVKFKDLKNIVECYNKGFTKKKSFDYYAKFEAKYKKYFGEKL
ncbi:TPA: transglycosylase SLT domain-containing protein [Campylobacter fetus subsp. venerealis]|nr:transglycosylase SLT domain-containing protein [Campylobacter fetus subsp. venerealis]HDX6324055.1 transglycosylase SLT domain-containing protein [Campylobacter fetus subsp. venerealis]